MNDVILMSELLRMRNASPVLLVQCQMKDAISDVRRARTLLAKAERKLCWAKQYKLDTLGQNPLRIPPYFRVAKSARQSSSNIPE